MIISLIAFVALLIIALGAGSNIYSALFSEDTTTQDLAQRIEFLTCAGGFGGALEESLQNGVCSPSDRYARTIYVASAEGSNRMIFFESPQQTITWKVLQVSESQFVPDTRVEELTYTNPLSSPAACFLSTRDQEITPARCFALNIPQGTRIASIAQKTGRLRGIDAFYPSTKTEEYTALYNTGHTYSEAVLEPINPRSQRGVVADFTFLLYLEYTPPTNEQPPRLLITTYDDDVFGIPTPEAARVGVLHSGLADSEEILQPNAQGRIPSIRSWCYEDDTWKYKLPFINQWYSASEDFQLGNRPGREGHRAITEELARSTFQEGLEVFEQYSQDPAFVIEIPLNSEAIKRACI